MGKAKRIQALIDGPTWERLRYLQQALGTPNRTAIIQMAILHFAEAHGWREHA